VDIDTSTNISKCIYIALFIIGFRVIFKFMLYI
jgi:hypothetical protein